MAKIRFLETLVSKVKLPTKLPVNGILTQGVPGEDSFVEKYKVEYSDDEQHWSCVMDMHSQPKVGILYTENVGKGVKFPP